MHYCKHCGFYSNKREWWFERLERWFTLCLIADDCELCACCTTRSSGKAGKFQNAFFLFLMKVFLCFTGAQNESACNYWNLDFKFHQIFSATKKEGGRRTGKTEEYYMVSNLQRQIILSGILMWFYYLLPNWSVIQPCERLSDKKHSTQSFACEWSVCLIWSSVV